MTRRTFQTVIFALFVLPIGGCGLTSEERIATLQTAVQTTQDLSNRLSAHVGELEKSLADAQALAKQPGVNPATVTKLQNDIAMLQAKIAQAKPLQTQLDKQLADYEEQVKVAMANKITVETEAKLYGQGVSTIGSVLPPPFNIYAGLIGTAITLGGAAIGAVVKGKKDDKAAGGLVSDVTDLINSPLVTDKEQAKSMLARAQAKKPATAKLVQKSLTKTRKAA